MRADQAPGAMAVRLGYDTKLLAVIGARFSKRVMRLLRRRCAGAIWADATRGAVRGRVDRRSALSKRAGRSLAVPD